MSGRARPRQSKTKGLPKSVGGLLYMAGHLNRSVTQRKLGFPQTQEGPLGKIGEEHKRPPLTQGSYQQGHPHEGAQQWPSLRAHFVLLWAELGWRWLSRAIQKSASVREGQLS